MWSYCSSKTVVNYCAIVHHSFRLCECPCNAPQSIISFICTHYLGYTFSTLPCVLLRLKITALRKKITLEGIRFLSDTKTVFLTLFVHISTCCNVLKFSPRPSLLKTCLLRNIALMLRTIALMLSYDIIKFSNEYPSLTLTF